MDPGGCLPDDGNSHGPDTNNDRHGARTGGQHGTEDVDKRHGPGRHGRYHGRGNRGVGQAEQRGQAQGRILRHAATDGEGELRHRILRQGRHEETNQLQEPGIQAAVVHGIHDGRRGDDDGEAEILQLQPHGGRLPTEEQALVCHRRTLPGQQDHRRSLQRHRGDARTGGTEHLQPPLRNGSLHGRRRTHTLLQELLHAARTGRDLRAQRTYGHRNRNDEEHGRDLPHGDRRGLHGEGARGSKQAEAVLRSGI